MNKYEKLLEVQEKLKAPKNQNNTFGKYKYRSTEDILEALKPLLKEVKAIVNISDQIEVIGDRYYVKAIAQFIDVEKGEYIESTAYAREAEHKKGMDEAQVTGSASSYARKYALNGLFAIDDTKDSDFTNTGEDKNTSKKNTKPNKGHTGSKLTKGQLDALYKLAETKQINIGQVKTEAYNTYGKTPELLGIEEYNKLYEKYKSM